MIAHVRKNAGGDWDAPQPLEEHLAATAELAARFAEDFGSAAWARAAALAHDAGKGREEWQRYLYGKSGFVPDADETAVKETGVAETGAAGAETTRSVEHSASGARLLEEMWPPSGAGRPLAYCVAGHHAGLPDYGGSPGALEDRLRRARTDDIPREIVDLLPSSTPPPPPWPFNRDGLDMALWIRMLFSCLVDADRLDTERYMTPEVFGERSGYASLEELRRRFRAYMETKTREPADANRAGNRAVNRAVYRMVFDARQRALADCLAAAESRPGFFSLTVPTGGGKTLASMGFALSHALKHGMKRVIYVIPYTSIIEQNADAFRKALEKDDGDAVLEHHSNIEGGAETLRSRLAAENWDAPVIVTTTIQFFESLFSALPGRCRKIHNIARSVVIFDEAQLIPPEHLRPILESLKLLVAHYRVSVVFCTATQPVFEKQARFPDFPGLDAGVVREIVKSGAALRRDMKRVEFARPDQKPVSWEDLAERLARERQVLCVVSDRKSCRELYAITRRLAGAAGTCHLSALMCAQHRSDVIAEIKARLSRGEDTRVISTQLVEAGVDIDFPVVYRAMAGFDSLAQAAGRCNREGALNAAGRLGRLVVFNGPRRPPAGTLRKAADTAEGLLRRGLSPLDHESYAPYFSEFYWKLNNWDTRGMMELLKPDSRLGIAFRTAGDAFRIIDDRNQRTIIVPYGAGAALLDRFIHRRISDRGALRKLQRCTINIYVDQFNEMKRRGSLVEVLSDAFPGVFALNNMMEYDRAIGLLVDETVFDPADLIL